MSRLQGEAPRRPSRERKRYHADKAAAKNRTKQAWKEIKNKGDDET